MRQPRIVPIFLLCLILSAATLLGQTKPPTTPAAPATATAPKPATTPATTPALPNPKTPAEFFARARQLSDLEASGIPFHLKATFVVSGDKVFTGNGTYEEWWQDKDHWRKTATLNKFSYVAFKNGTEIEKAYTNLPYIPWQVEQVMGSIFFRVPNDAATVHWKMHHKKIKRMEFTVLSDKYRQYLFTHEGLLRILSSIDDQTIYNNYRAFQNMDVPCTITFGFGGKDNRIAISIDELERIAPGQQTISLIGAIPHDLQPLGLTPPDGMPIGGPVSPPILTHRVEPDFQLSVRQIYKSDDYRVVVGFIVDKQGKVEDAHVFQSDGSDLEDTAVLRAVRQYRFKSAMFKGNPVRVKLQITMVFHNRSFQ